MFAHPFMTTVYTGASRRSPSHHYPARPVREERFDKNATRKFKQAPGRRSSSLGLAAKLLIATLMVASVPSLAIEVDTSSLPDTDTRRISAISGRRQHVLSNCNMQLSIPKRSFAFAKPNSSSKFSLAMLDKAATSRANALETTKLTCSPPKKVVPRRIHDDEFWPRSAKCEKIYSLFPKTYV